MSILDISIVNVAIPTMQRDFSATTEQIQWVENAYSLALGVVVPVSAWLASRADGELRLVGQPRRRLRAVRARLGPQQHRRLPRCPGDGRRRAAGRHADDPLQDRAEGEDRCGDGHVRPGHRRRARDRPHAGRLPRGVRRLAADLLHQRAGRHRRVRRRPPRAAQVPRRVHRPLRRVGLPDDRDRAASPASARRSSSCRGSGRRRWAASTSSAS